MRKIFGAIAILSLLATVAFPNVAKADPYFEEGVRRYTKKDFRNACAYFEQSIKNCNDPNAYYYAGLCWYQLRDFRRAALRYKDVVRQFPDEPAAKNALIALQTLDPASALAGLSKGSGSNSRGSDLRPVDNEEGDGANNLDLSHCPGSTKIYYRQSDNPTGIAFMVTAYVNNRPIDMLFDTGAETITMSKQHCQKLGLPLPTATQKPHGHAFGVGSTSGSPYWRMRYNLRIGDLIIPNCPVDVQDNMTSDPLLGQTLFKHFAYTIDYGAKSITLTKKDQYRVAHASNSKYSVPFTREGNEMIVDTEVNGKPCKMYFDTGAMGVSFPQAAMRKLQIEVPEDAEEGRSIGVNGSTRSWSFPIQRMKMGPIEKTNFTVHMVEASGISKPLLGQDFYAGWQYTIDNDQKMIHFVRR